MVLLIYPYVLKTLEKPEFLLPLVVICLIICCLVTSCRSYNSISQIHRCLNSAYCQEHGIKVDQWIEDIGSALNYKRKGFNAVIEQIELGLVKRLVIGYQDRFVRFGYDWFEQFCERHGTEILIINGEAYSPEEELVRDLIAIVTVFSARLHGLRSHKNLIRAAALGKDITDD